MRFTDVLSDFGEHFGLEDTQTSEEVGQEGSRAFLEQERVAPADAVFEAVLDVKGDVPERFHLRKLLDLNSHLLAQSIDLDEDGLDDLLEVLKHHIGLRSLKLHGLEKEEWLFSSKP
jgi:hypothetical protein